MFTEMLFGRERSQKTFQRAKDVMLASTRWKDALLYFEDIFVFCYSAVDRTGQMWCVVWLLYETEFTLKLKKWKVFADTMDYLHHFIQPSSARLAKHATRALTKVVPPALQTDLCLFLRLCNAFRRMYQNFAHHAADLNKILEKNNRNSLSSGWNDECPSCVLLTSIGKPAVLALTKSKGHYTLDTDSCGEQFQFVLQKEVEEVSSSPVGYWSRTLTSKEQKLITTHRVSPTVLKDVPLLQLYLKGARFLIRTE